MKIKFFEWSEYEEKISKDLNIYIPDTIEKINDLFSIESARGYDCISLRNTKNITKADLDELRKSGCTAIALRKVGYENLDIEYAKSIGINIYRVAAYSPESIAEYTIMLILILARQYNLTRHKHSEKTFDKNINQIGFVLQGKTLGLQGYGRIAKHVARIARHGFGMNVQFYDPYVPESDFDNKVEDLTKLYSTSDIVSIHVPLNNETENCVNKSILLSLKPGFMLINTSRGGVVNSEDVKTLFKEGKIKYLGIDVWSIDNKFDDELLTFNSIQSNHVAFFTEEAVRKIIEQTLESVSGNPRPENIL